MTEAAHKSAKICHSNNPANLQGDALSVRRLTLAWNWEEIRETSEIFLSIIKMILVIKMKGEGGVTEFSSHDDICTTTNVGMNLHSCLHGD